MFTKDEINEVINIVEELRSESSTNNKKDILERNKDNELLKQVLEYTYNPFKKYGISDKSINIKGVNSKAMYIDIFTLLDTLAKSNINDDLRELTNLFLSVISNEKEQDLYKCMILKDLKIGCNAKTINKIWKDLIPEFGVMLAESYFKQKEGFLRGREFVLTTKLDGNRLIIIKEDGVCNFYTRQGKLMEGLIELEAINDKLVDNMVYDGELIAENVDNLPSDELFRVTMTKARKKGVKTGLIFNCFDCLPLEDFKKGKCNIPFIERKIKLKAIIMNVDSKFFIEVPILYQGTDESQILEYITWARSRDLEGIMINITNAPYECKRTKNILKGKVFQDCDVRVLDVIEGTGKNVGKLGSITIQFAFEDKLYSCDCGSGFSDEERELYWTNKDLLLGKIVTIGYFEISQNNKTKEYGLRFPTWKGIIRNDKDEISMN